MRSSYLLACIAVIIICCSACSKATPVAMPPSSETAPVCAVTTASGASAEASWYEGNSFNFNYDVLPLLTINGFDTLLFSVNWDTDVLTVGEDYYAYPSEQTGVCYKETYELQRNTDGLFTMEIQRLNNIRDEQAIYYIVTDEGKFVIKVLLPVTESNT